MKKRLMSLAQGLADDPAAVRVTADAPNEEGTTVYCLHVGEGDVGCVIGKQGRIVKAIRAMTCAVGTRSDAALPLRKGSRLPARSRQYEIWYLLLLEALHLVLPLNWSDDSVFFQKASRLALPQFLNGSSRVWIDTLTWCFAKQPIFWRVLNPLVLLLLAVLLTRLLRLRTQSQKIVLSLLILYPAMVMADAGFMATTLNYLWPFAMGVFVVYALLDCKPWRVVLAIPALLFAANMQQSAVGLLAALAILVFFFLQQKQSRKALLAAGYGVLTLASLGFLYYTSFFGENPRFLRETARYFPNFAALSLLQKVELGFSSTFLGFSSLTNRATAASALLCLFLCAAALRREEKKWVKILAFVPPGLLTAIALFRLTGRNTRLWQLLSPAVDPKLSHAVYRFSLFETAAALLLLGVILLLLLRLVRTRKRQALLCGILALGFGLRLLMGFSPTVWASGCRTFFPSVMAVIVCIMMMIEEWNALRINSSSCGGKPSATEC